MKALFKNKKKIKEVDFFQIFTTDLNGKLMTLQVSPENVKNSNKLGVGFDSSSVAGIGTIDESDKLLVPIPASYKLLKLKDEKIGFFIGQIFDRRGIRSKSDPRLVLEKTLEKAKSKGFQFLTGPEHEFFLLTDKKFQENIHSDTAGYFHADPYDKGDLVRKRIINVMESCGVEFIKSHHEVTASQHEITFNSTSPLKAADRTLLFNYITSKIAQENKLYATMMPKPFDGQNRNALHIHLSMWSSKGKNLFYDKIAKYNLSKLGRQFIGGILKYARESSIIMASTFNSYKAYVIEREAPVSIGWGIKNRSSMVRLPYVTNPRNFRVELRNPDPSGNIYLQMATLIEMGMRGIEEKLDCGDPDIGSTYKRQQLKFFNEKILPKDMSEALMEAEKSTFLKELLGDYIYNNYMALKIADWEEHRTHVTVREYQKYLGI